MPEGTPLLLQLIIQGDQEVLPFQFQVQVVRYQVVRYQAIIVLILLHHLAPLILTAGIAIPTLTMSPSRSLLQMMKVSRDTMHPQARVPHPAVITAGQALLQRRAILDQSLIFI